MRNNKRYDNLECHIFFLVARNSVIMILLISKKCLSDRNWDTNKDYVKQFHRLLISGKVEY